MDARGERPLLVVETVEAVDAHDGVPVVATVNDGVEIDIHLTLERQLAQGLKQAAEQFC